MESLDEIFGTNYEDGYRNSLVGINMGFMRNAWLYVRLCVCSIVFVTYLIAASF